MRRRVFAAGLLPALATAPARAQVDTEKLRLSPRQDGLSGKLEAGLALKTGNVQLLDVSGEAAAVLKKGRHTSFFVGHGQFAAKRTGSDRLSDPNTHLLDPDARYVNALMGHLRYDLRLDDQCNGEGRVSWEVFTQLEYDQFLLLKRRALVGTGPRVTLARSERAAAWLGTTPLLEDELLEQQAIAPTEPTETLAVRWSNYLTGQLVLSGHATLGGTVYVQPRIGDFTDYRVLADSSLDVDVTDHLALGLAFTLRHDSQPPQVKSGDPVLLPTDTSVSNTLTWTF